MIEATTAAVPPPKNHGNRGTTAPTEKPTNDDTAAATGDPSSLGVDAQLLPGVGLQGQLGVPHELARPCSSAVFGSTPRAM